MSLCPQMMNAPLTPSYMVPGPQIRSCIWPASAALLPALAWQAREVVLALSGQRVGSCARREGAW